MAKKKFYYRIEYKPYGALVWLQYHNAPSLGSAEKKVKALEIEELNVSMAYKRLFRIIEVTTKQKERVIYG